jgi:hypothetical protein
MVAAKNQKLCEGDQSTSDFSKTEFYALNDDCIREILDWLPIAELAAMKMTCSRFYWLANEHFRKTYVNELTWFNKDGSDWENTVSEKKLSIISVSHGKSTLSIICWN